MNVSVAVELRLNENVSCVFSSGGLSVFSLEHALILQAGSWLPDAMFVIWQSSNLPKFL